MRTGTIAVFAVLLIGIVLFTPIQSQAQLPASLQQAMEQIEAGQIEPALNTIQAYLTNYPSSPHNAAAQILAGRCELQQGKYEDAMQRAHNVLRSRTSRGMAPQAHYLMASVYQARGEAYEAALELVYCLNLSPRGQVARLAEAKLRELVQGPVYYKLDLLRDQAYSSAAENALENLSLTETTIPRIGIVLGSTEEDTVARDMLNGARAAVEWYNREHDPDAELMEESVSGGTADLVLGTRRLVQEDGVWGMIVGGNIERSLAATVEAQAASVPVVLAGQRRPGLFSIGPTTVQPEADWYREGEMAALYAADSLHLRTYVIVAPATERGQESVAGFTDVLARRGQTEIMSVEWYFPEQGLSLDRQFRRIRNLGFRRDFADSLGWYHIQNDSTNFNILWEAHLDSIRRSYEYRIGAIDSNDIQIRSIDALYFPIEEGTIELFAPQFAFYNFRAQTLGNSAWYDIEGLYRHRQYVEDMVFTSPYFHADTNVHMQQLSTYIARVIGGTPSLWNVRGYDAAMILLNQVASGQTGVSGVAEGILNLRDIAFASGRQYFNRDKRAGEGMWFLTVHEGTIERENISRRRILTTPPPPPVVPLDSLDMEEPLDNQPISPRNNR